MCKVYGYVESVGQRGDSIEMKLRKVISGGQTGADRAGLECAKALGLQTGGTVPRGWRTDEGPDPSLKDFGCIESYSETYPPRTEANVKNSDCTIWFGNVHSPGGKLTKSLCKKHKKDFIENPDAFEMRHIAETYEVANVAGNRRRTNPTIGLDVVSAFKGVQACQEQR